MDMDGSWVWCPECGEMTWIAKCDKTGVCFHCSAFVLNPDWEGWEEKKSGSGCAGAAVFLLVCAAALPTLLVRLLSGL
ncbi:MAG: hypothetical protein IJH47_01690 [Oscillospiraceae bacterium]|nr:hypothetical protein [Oscillospiraceae bacterium]